MNPYPHQIELAEQGLSVLRNYGIVYLAFEERTGKTLTSILIAEESKANNILVLTKKKALDGWTDTLNKFAHTKNYHVTNYHQAGKLSVGYDLIILDESHSYLSKFPKIGKIWKDVAKLTKDVPLIYLSATPYAQGAHLLFNQFKLSSFTPFPFKNGYDFFRVYGVPNKVRTSYGLQETYTAVKDSEVIAKCRHLFITKTREELDFEHEPTDVIHWVELDEETKHLYNECLSDQIMIANGDEIELDSPMKLRTTLHMLEGGAGKHEKKYYVLPNCEKVNAIKKDFGDSESLCIMYNYIAEGQKLRQHFKKALILQGTSFAEGVSLSHIEHLVIYSQDFSTARHSQRRARQANKQRASAINVHFYLVRGAISEQVYKTVSVNKTNFIDKLFKRIEL